MKIRDCVLIEAFQCNENDSIIDVAKKLREISLRHIFVVDENDSPIGIISMTDINNRVVAEGKNPQEIKAKDVMTSPVDVAHFDDEIETPLGKMISKNHVMSPVVRDKKMVGIISAHQLIKGMNKNG